jgi:hypothetical protein
MDMEMFRNDLAASLRQIPKPLLQEVISLIFKNKAVLFEVVPPMIPNLIRHGRTIGLGLSGGWIEFSDIEKAVRDACASIGLTVPEETPSNAANAG